MMAIYTKHDQKIINESIRVEGSCYFDEKLLKVWALVEGATTERQFFISDLKGDNGTAEVNDVIRAVLKTR